MEINNTYLLILLILFVILFVLIIILVPFVVFVLAVLLHVNCCLFLPLHAALGKLLHHLQELLAIVLEKIICDRQNVPYFRAVNMNMRSGAQTKGTCRSQ